MKQDIWFKRKKYGWGWTPANKFGWMAIFSYVMLALAVTTIAPISFSGFLISLLLLTSGFIWLCFKKGEKPKWSWGDDNPSKK